MGQLSFTYVFIREPYDDMARMEGRYGGSEGGRNCSVDGLRLILPMYYAFGEGSV